MSIIYWFLNTDIGFVVLEYILLLLISTYTCICINFAESHVPKQWNEYLRTIIILSAPFTLPSILLAWLWHKLIFSL